MNFRTPSYSILGLAVIIFCFSCSSNSENENQKNGALLNEKIAETVTTSQPPLVNTQSLELKTFEIKDTVSGKSLGWGYDIFVDGKRNIHQPILPGVAGNQHFSSEEDATLTGTFAVNRMKQTGGLPTITLKELDSLGVIPKAYM